MKKVLVSIALTLLTLKAQAASAVYFSYEENKMYVRIKQPTEEIAKQKAKEYCAEINRDCKYESSSRHGGYGAVARNKKSEFITVLSYETKQAAAKEALDRCNKYYGDCKVTGSWYDSVFIPKEVLEREAAEEEEKIRAINSCYGRYGAPMECGSQYDVDGRHWLTGKLIGQP